MATRLSLIFRILLLAKASHIERHQRRTCGALRLSSSK